MITLFEAKETMADSVLDPREVQKTLECGYSGEVLSSFDRVPFTPRRLRLALAKGEVLMPGFPISLTGLNTLCSSWFGELLDHPCVTERMEAQWFLFEARRPPSLKGWEAVAREKRHPTQRGATALEVIYTHNLLRILREEHVLWHDVTARATSSEAREKPGAAVVVCFKRMDLFLEELEAGCDWTGGAAWMPLCDFGEY